LQRIPLDGGEPVRLTNNPASWPRVSPDGRWIACGYTDLNDPSHPKLAIISIAGGQPVNLFDVPDSANFQHSIRWTPDGKAVTYRDWENGIWKQDLNGTKPERLNGLPQEKLHAYGWSSDGKLFAFTRGLEMRDVVLISSKKAN
jgi:Tol biopolymer transport system component